MNAPNPAPRRTYEIWKGDRRIGTSTGYTAVEAIDLWVQTEADKYGEFGRHGPFMAREVTK